MCCCRGGKGARKCHPKGLSQHNTTAHTAEYAEGATKNIKLPSSSFSSHRTVSRWALLVANLFLLSTESGGTRQGNAYVASAPVKTIKKRPVSAHERECSPPACACPGVVVFYFYRHFSPVVSRRHRCRPFFLFSNIFISLFREKRKREWKGRGGEIITIKKELPLLLQGPLIVSCLLVGWEQ